MGGIQSRQRQQLSFYDPEIAAAGRKICAATSSPTSAKLTSELNHALASSGWLQKNRSKSLSKVWGKLCNHWASCNAAFDIMGSSVNVVCKPLWRSAIP